MSNHFDVTRNHRFDADDADASPLVSFTSRETYLEWVKDWKAALRGTVEDIRAQKAVRRDKSQTDYVRYSANEERQMLRVAAHNLIQLRLAGKRRAVAQVEAARAAGPLAAAA